MSKNSNPDLAGAKYVADFTQTNATIDFLRKQTSIFDAVDCCRGLEQVGFANALQGMGLVGMHDTLREMHEPFAPYNRLVEESKRLGESFLPDRVFEESKRLGETFLPDRVFEES